MDSKIWVVLVSLAFSPFAARSQPVTFSFDDAPVQTSLPMDLTAGSITAHFAATGQGFSIQRADTMGFRPAGFSGLCIYPNSVFPADLLITFSRTITSFALLYSPQELGCDDSARMKVTADLNGTTVGSATATAPAPGTWPTGTLTFSSGVGFNHVVVHYDAKPPTCQDWGPIFLADNLTVTPGPEEILLSAPKLLPDGSFQFGFEGNSGAAYSVLSTTDLRNPPASWSVRGDAVETRPGHFEFTDPVTPATTPRFYRVKRL